MEGSSFDDKSFVKSIQYKEIPTHLPLRSTINHLLGTSTANGEPNIDRKWLNYLKRIHRVHHLGGSYHPDPFERLSN